MSSLRSSEVLGGELELGRRRVRAKLGRIAPPDALLSDLHNIGFVAGEKAIDSVTGQEVEVVGSGVEQVETRD
jgi:hypothetical protein